MSGGRRRGPSSQLTRVGLWAPPIIYMAAIFQLSSQTNPLPQLTALVWDKLLHTTEYAGLAFLLSRALVGEGVSWIVGIIVVCAPLAVRSYEKSLEK